MKSIGKLFITVVLSTLVLSTSAQVKQVFQVLHFDTKQPIEGATSSMYGQTLTTNAKGVAVANLPADKKGAYLPLEKWEKDGFTFNGRTPSSFWKDFQTSDTIKFYMVETSTYYKVLDDQTLKLFRYWYDDAVMEYINSMRDSVRNHPDETTSLAGNMMEAVMAVKNPVRLSRDDASDIIKYYMPEFEKPAFAEVLKVLRSGDVDSAVAMVRNHIDTTDNSRENLEWIDLYRDLKVLNLGSEDDGLISDYTVYLYKNHYSNDEAVNYIQDLNRDNRYEMADSISRLEKANNRNPRYQDVFEPSVVQYMFGEKQDFAKMKTTAEDRLRLNITVYEKYPYYKTLGDLAWAQKNMYFVYVLLDDSVSATHAVDSALAYQDNRLAYYKDSKYKYNQTLISDYQNILDVLNDNPAYIPEQTRYELCDAIFNASKENYESDTSNLFLKMQLAENALYWLQNAPQNEESGPRRMEVVKQLNDMLTKLSNEFPEYYTLQNVQVASQLLANCLMQGCDNDKMQDAFRRYEQSFDAVNAVFPNLCNEVFLRFNTIVESYMTSGQMFALTEELDRFNDRLLNIKAEGDPQKLLILRAERANQVAESLYSDEAYDDAVGYYLQANELYMKAIQHDEQQWIPYLRNYLQMGDAHLYQNQFDKAMMTYQKILDFEPQIPATMMPQYTRMKGNVYYYIGDVYKATGEIANAEKAYKTAEKWFKKAISMGDQDAYQSMGEMYWGKAVLAAQNEDMKKCRQMVAKSVIFYEQTELDVPLKTYERAKSVMADFYKEDNDGDNYYRTVADLTKYYEKFVEYDRDYIVGMLENAEKMLNSGRITNEEALHYSQDLLDGLLYLNDMGEDVELPYLRSLFNMARAYVVNDSIKEAIELYRACQDMNVTMYKDTSEKVYKNNMVEIYTKLPACYEKMAEEIDTAHSDLWYYRAIDTRDTLIELLKETNVDGDVNKTYQTAVQYRNNAGVFYHLEMMPSAQDYLDKSNELLMMLYNSEYKTEVEEDVIQNYTLRAAFYQDAGNDEKAIENFRTAVSYGEKADLSEQVPPYYYAAIPALLELLQKDEAANAQEIAKLKKELKEISKKLK